MDTILQQVNELKSSEQEKYRKLESLVNNLANEFIKLSLIPFLYSTIELMEATGQMHKRWKNYKKIICENSSSWNQQLEQKLNRNMNYVNKLRNELCSNTGFCKKCITDECSKLGCKLAKIYNQYLSNKVFEQHDYTMLNEIDPDYKEKRKLNKKFIKKRTLNDNLRILNDILELFANDDNIRYILQMMVYIIYILESKEYKKNLEDWEDTINADLQRRNITQPAISGTIRTELLSSPAQIIFLQNQIERTASELNKFNINLPNQQKALSNFKRFSNISNTIQQTNENIQTSETVAQDNLKIRIRLIGKIMKIQNENPNISRENLKRYSIGHLKALTADKCDGRIVCADEALRKGVERYVKLFLS